MWRKEYKKREFYWGIKPDSILVKFLSKISKGKALDIGSGEGRNSIFLAQNGFKVESVDILKEGLDKCSDTAQKYNLPIITRCINIKNFKFNISIITS